MTQIPSLESFDCEGEPASVGLRWEKWKRGFELYATASNVNDPEKKRANLLHCGGLALQEIYYNLPGAHIDVPLVPDANINVYKTAITKLDEYFSPKQSKVYERHLFRLIKQDNDEKFEKFLVRLRHQSKKCSFINEEEHLIDQITEKCSSIELRKKILTLGDSVTLDKILSEANGIEAVGRQLTNFGAGHSTDQIVNKVEAFKRLDFKQNRTPCTRCGSTRHKSDSATCPAKFKQCNKCGFIGHFMSQCKTAVLKRKHVKPDPYKYTKKFKPNDNDKKPDKEKINYVFHIDEDTVVNCELGGVNIDMIIDSGSKCNIISDRSWGFLKSCGVNVEDQNKGSDKKFMAYGSQKPLTVLGTFKANIRLGPNTKPAIFYVIEGGERNLLGKDTSISLGVLKIGLSQVNAVDANMEIFP